MSEVDGRVAGLKDLPRKNGELVFEAPWQSRAFGMVVSLHTAGRYPWNDFKERLIGAIAAGPCPDVPADAPDYYYHWVAAFCRLLVEKGADPRHRSRHGATVLMSFAALKDLDLVRALLPRQPRQRNATFPSGSYFLPR